MRARNLVLASLAVLSVVALPVTNAHALLVKVSINFGPTITGPDDGTLIVTANPGDHLRITWALGTDTSIGRYRGAFGADTVELTQVFGSALELTGQGFDPGADPNFGPFPFLVESDGAPIGFAGSDGELWQIDYVATAPATDTATDMTHTIGIGGCLTEFADVCPGTSGTDAVSASLRVDLVPEPSTLLLFGLGLAALAGFGRRLRAREPSTRTFTLQTVFDGSPR